MDSCLRRNGRTYTNEQELLRRIDGRGSGFPVLAREYIRQP